MGEPVVSPGPGGTPGPPSDGVDPVWGGESIRKPDRMAKSERAWARRLNCAFFAKKIMRATPIIVTTDRIIIKDSRSCICIGLLDKKKVTLIIVPVFSDESRFFVDRIPKMLM
jgi:hypothetical protein